MLTTEEKLLLKIQTLTFIASALAGGFVQIYIFKLTGFTGVVFYNLIAYSFLLVTYILSGYILRRYSTAVLIRCGLFITTTSYLLLILLKENAVHYLPVLGMISGIAMGSFYSGFNLSQYILTHSHSRDHYFGKGQVFINLSYAIGPLIGGALISSINTVFNQNYVGYYVIFLIVVMINGYAFFVAKNIPHHTGIEFSFKDLLTHQRSKKWQAVLLQNINIGLYDVAYGTMFATLLYVIIGKESQIGIIRSCIMLLTAVVSFYAGKVISRFKKMYIFGAIGVTVSIIAFALQQTWLGIVLYGFFNGISAPFLNIPLSSVVLNTIDENKEIWQRKYAMFIERDGVLGIARVISYLVLFLLFSRFNKNVIAENSLVVMSIFPLILGILLFKTTKRSS